MYSQGIVTPVEVVLPYQQSSETDPRLLLNQTPSSSRIDATSVTTTQTVRRLGTHVFTDASLMVIEKGATLEEDYVGNISARYIQPEPGQAQELERSGVKLHNAAGSIMADFWPRQSAEDPGTTTLRGDLGTGLDRLIYGADCQ